MRSIFLVRETTSGYWLSSTKHRHFEQSPDSAALFEQQANAQKAVKDLQRMINKKDYPYALGSTYFALKPREFYLQSPGYGLEVVECELRIK